MIKAVNTPSAPYSVILMIIRRCNLHCLHCCASPDQFSRDDMTTKEILATVDELAKHQVFEIEVTGGEPLLHPDFRAIIDRIVQYPMRLQINTNATLVSDATAAYLARLPRRLVLSVSLDGITAETYDQIRGANSFADMMRGIRRLTAAGLRVRPFMVLSRLNYRELPQIIAFANSIGTSRVNISMPAACGRAPQHAEEMALQTNELEEALEMVLRAADRNPGRLTGPWVRMAHIYRELLAGRWANAAINNEAIFRNCAGAWRQLAIACDGTVSPCDMSYAYRTGNIRDRPLMDIWRNSPALRATRECRAIPLAQVHGCEDCRWHQICAGPCPGSGYAVTGVWPSSAPGCITRQIGELCAAKGVAPERNWVS